MRQPSTEKAVYETAPSGETGEQYNGYTLMVEAYAAIWLVLMGWLVFLWRKQADLSRRVQGLEAAISRAEKKASTKSSKAPPAAETEEARA
jgi:CcmD family protein